MSIGRIRYLTERRTALLLTLLGAGLVMLAGTRTWANVSVDGALPGLSDLVLTGQRAAPVMPPIALAAAAGAIVLATSNRIVRFVVAVGLLLAGAAVVVNGARFAGDPDAAASAAVSANLGAFDDGASTTDGLGALVYSYSDVGFSLWPWVAVAGGGLILLAGLLTTVGGRAWSGPSRRYERSSAPGAVPTDPAAARSSDSVAAARQPDETPASTWDALSRGEDPTSSPTDST